MKVCSVCQRCYEDDVFSCIEENHNSFYDVCPEWREIITGFRLDVLLESVATGTTYKATDLNLNQPCLIKLINPVSDDRQNLNQHFLNEARLIAAVNHPNLVRVYQFGILESGELYFVTEEVGGQTLRDCLSKVGSPSEVTAIQIARQTAEGLEAIHTAGVTHRNINPENIILTSDTEHRLLIKLQNFDFGGINQQITTSETLDSTYRLNSLRYFSPEQCTGQAVDAQTDIYSLGIVLYEMLAGKPPFDAPSADGLIDKQVKMPPPEVKIANFDIRALLTYTLMDSLQKIPRLRLKKANAFARQLRHIEQLATHSPTPPPAISIQPATNKVVVAEQSEIPNIETTSLATNFKDSIETNNDLPSSPVPEITEIAVIAQTDDSVNPPLEESVIEIIAENELLPQPEATQQELILVEQVNISDTLPTFKQNIVDWEQPEDIPSELEVLEVRRKEFGDSSFVPTSFPLDEEPVTVISEPAFLIDEVIDIDKIRQIRAEAVPIFAHYTDNQSQRFSVVNKMSVIGAGLVVLIILGVMGSILIIGRFQTEQTVTQSPPTEKLLPKSVESEVVSKKDTDSTEKSDKSGSKDKTVAEDDSGSSNFKVSEVKKRPTLSSSASKRPDRNQVSEKTPDNKIKQDKLKAEESSANDEAKKQETSSEKKTVVEKQSPAATKSNIFTRPRIVKTRVIP